MPSALWDYEVTEISGEYLCLNGTWYGEDDIEVLAKLEPKPKVSKAWRLTKTEGLDCPLMKETCNRKCAWFREWSGSCAVLHIAEDIAAAVEEGT